MLKIHKNTLFDTKKVLILLMLFAVLSLALFAYNYEKNGATADPTNKVKPAPAVLSDEDARNKESFINRDQNQEKSKLPKDSQIKASFENSGLTVSSKLYSISDGECQLVVKNGTQEIIRAAQVIYQPTYSTCAGFSIDKSEFSNGAWDVILTIKSVEGTEEVLRTTIDINS